MTQGVPGEDEMTSRAAGPTDEERAEFKRGELQAVRDLMCNHDIEAIRQEVRDDIRARVKALRADADAGYAMKSDTDDPVAYDAGRIGAFDAVLAAISSSSATETQDGERPHVDDIPGPHPESPDWHAGYRAARNELAATPTPDDRDLRTALAAFGKRLAAEGYGWEAIITREGPNREETVAHLTTANPDPPALDRPGTIPVDAIDAIKTLPHITVEKMLGLWVSLDQVVGLLKGWITPDDRDRQVERLLRDIVQAMGNRTLVLDDDGVIVRLIQFGEGEPLDARTGKPLGPGEFAVTGSDVSADPLVRALARAMEIVGPSGISVQRGLPEGVRAGQRRGEARRWPASLGRD